MQARGCVVTSVALVACVASLCATRPARANGRFPQASQIVFSPSDPHTMVMRTTFGVLVSRDDGASWQWVCEGAIGLGNAQEDPCYGVTQGGAIVGGLWQGLAVSPDTGCNWAFAGGALANQVVADLAVRPDDRRSVVAVTGTWDKSAGTLDGGGVAYISRVFGSADDGAHWSPLGVALDPAVKVLTIEVAESNPHRIYVSSTRGAGAARTAQLFVSSDDGATWAERAIPLLAGVETGAYIGAVDPSNADLVYVRTDAHSRLLVSNDAGQSFAAASFAAADGGVATSFNGFMFGFALSPDGAKIYAGGVGADGVYVGARGSSVLSHRSDVHVECLGTRGSEVWACSDVASGFLMGVSTDDGATFTPKLRLTGVDGVLRCPSASTVTQCQTQYDAQCARLGGCASSNGDADAGASDAGAEADAAVVNTATAEAPGGASGGCAAGGRGASAGFLAVSATTGLALLRRRRRRKTRDGGGRAES